MLLNFDRLGWWKYILLAITLLTAAFLLLPIVFIAALSFGSSQWLIFPPPSWTLQWYSELFADPRWLESAWTSFKIAVIVTILSVLLGLVTSFGLVRGSFLFRDALKALFLTPMILPVVVLAVALYAFFLRIGLGGTLVGFVISHLVLALPFSILSISSALEGFDKSIEDAAVLCGALASGSKDQGHPAGDQPWAVFGGRLLVPDILGRGGGGDLHVQPDPADAAGKSMGDAPARSDAGRRCGVDPSHPFDDHLDGAGCRRA